MQILGPRLSGHGHIRISKFNFVAVVLTLPDEENVQCIFTTTLCTRKFMRNSCCMTLCAKLLLAFLSYTFVASMDKSISEEYVLTLEQNLLFPKTTTSDLRINEQLCELVDFSTIVFRWQDLELHFYCWHAFSHTKYHRSTKQ